MGDGGIQWVSESLLGPGLHMIIASNLKLLAPNLNSLRSCVRPEKELDVQTFYWGQHLRKIKGRDKIGYKEHLLCFVGLTLVKRSGVGELNREDLRTAVKLGTLHPAQPCSSPKTASRRIFFEWKLTGSTSPTVPSY